jgi:hypothetical protein
MSHLAINGGPPVRTEPYPEWPKGDDADVAAVEAVVRGGRWGGFPEPGPNAAAFEERFATYQGAKHGILMSNGTVTMEVALKALGIGPGDEVIVPAMTFAATAYAPMASGALPVFVDVTPETWTSTGADEAASRLCGIISCTSSPMADTIARRDSPKHRLAISRTAPRAASGGGSGRIGTSGRSATSPRRS